MIKLLLILLALQSGDVNTGPLSDAIAKRLDKIAERVETNSQMFDRLYERLEESQGTRLSQLLGAIQEAKAERQGIVATIQELRLERDSIRESLQEFREGREGVLSRLSNISGAIQDARAETERRWTPLQNLVDRLTSLVWKLLWLLVAVVVVVLAFGLVATIAYARVNSLFRRGLP